MEELKIRAVGPFSTRLDLGVRSSPFIHYELQDVCLESWALGYQGRGQASNLYICHFVIQKRKPYVSVNQRLSLNSLVTKNKTSLLIQKERGGLVQTTNLKSTPPHLSNANKSAFIFYLVLALAPTSNVRYMKEAIIIDRPRD